MSNCFGREVEMTYKELLELIQELNEEQLNKEVTIWIPDNMPSGFTTDVSSFFSFERWSETIEPETPYLNLVNYD